jgi:serine phosphatase RsbU (regulator of sigma subunit)
VHVFAAGSLLALAVLLPFHFIDRQEQFIGVPAAITSLIVVGGALVGGPRVGVALAFLGGITYDTLVVTDRWLMSGATTAAVLFVWVVAGLAAGMLGDRYRAQVARSLDQAHRSRDALDRVVQASPSFHAHGSAASVARAICDGARSTFDCDLAALFAIEGERLRLLARSPFLAKAGERLIVEPSPELQRELADYLLPRFVADIRTPGGPRIPRAITTDVDQVSALRAPVLLDDQPVALLAMSWAQPRPEPDLSELGVVQRFAEHAAVALAQSQRTQAQREAATLYRRFQASLAPNIAVTGSGVRATTLYRPGERRMLLGGDFVDAVTRPDGTLAAVIGDVTGHGPDAAALGTSLRAAWRALVLRGATLEQSLSTLNDLTLDESDRVEQRELGFSLLATVCVLEIDAVHRRARFASAGHPPPLLLGPDVEPLRYPPGLILGVDTKGLWPPHDVELPADWAILLYSDGITEAREAPDARTRLGVDGLTLAIADLWARRALETADLTAMIDAAQTAQGGPLDDDVTLLLLAAEAETHS